MQKPCERCKTSTRGVCSTDLCKVKNYVKYTFEEVIGFYVKEKDRVDKKIAQYAIDMPDRRGNRKGVPLPPECRRSGMAEPKVALFVPGGDRLALKQAHRSTVPTACAYDEMMVTYLLELESLIHPCPAPL